MLALFSIRSYSQTPAIDGCTNDNTFDVGIPATLTHKKVDAGKVICFKGSIVIQANKDITATYKFVDESQGIDGELKTLDKPYFIGSHEKKPYIMIKAIDNSMEFDISVVSVHGSKIETDKNIWEVFTTISSFKRSTTVSRSQSIRLIAESKNIISKAIISKDNIQKQQTIDGQTDLDEGNSLYLELSHDGDEETVDITYNEVLERSSESFLSLFENNIFYILPGEGAFNIVDVKKFNQDHRDIFTRINSDSDDESEWDQDAIIECNGIIGNYNELVNKIYTIEEGGTICSKGSFVFASKDKFKVMVYKPKEREGKQYQNPFSSSGYHMNIIKCADESKECKVHILTLIHSRFDESHTSHSIFTTKNELKFSLDFNDKEYFAITAHSAQNKVASISFTKDDAIFAYESDTQNNEISTNIQGKTIIGYFREQPRSENRAIIEIKEVKSALDGEEETLFENGLVYEIPEGVKSEDEVKSFSKDSKIKFVSNPSTTIPSPQSTKPDGKKSLPPQAIAVIAIICIVLWLLVFKKERVKKDSGSGEDVT